jgi:hypothetical protein
MFRVFESDSGLIAISATGLSAPLLYIAPAATAPGNLFKVKVSCEAGAGTPTVPTSSSLAFTLNKTTGTKAGGAAVTPSPTGPDTTAAQTVVSSGTTAITGLTSAAELWEGTIPFSPGSFAGDDDPNTGEEVWLAPSGTYAFYVTVPAGPGFGSNLFARVVMWHAE